MTLDEATDRAVAAILSDIGDRRGIGDELDGIDAETRGAMVDKWRCMVRAAIESYAAAKVAEAAFARLSAFEEAAATCRELAAEVERAGAARGLALSCAALIDALAAKERTP